MNRKVYLDHNASTPVHPDVIQAMLPYFGERFGNPSSVHGFGREARDGMETAREQVSRFLKVKKEEIVFTSGGTESDNMAIKGIAHARRRGHIITSQIEHHAVLRTCESLEENGFEVTYLPVDGYGMVDPEDVRRAIRPDTILVTLMHANSEAGTIQPMREIGRITRETEVPLHVDGVQTFGKVPIDVDAFGIDLLSFSGHKIYGPKGVGGLYIRRGTKMVSVQHGGEHERSRRAGTENVAGIVGLGAAVEIRGREMTAEGVRLTCAPRPALGRSPRPDPRGAAERPPDGAAARHVQSVLPRRRVGIDRPRIGSEGHRRVGRVGLHVGQCRAVVRARRDGRAGRVGDGGGSQLAGPWDEPGGHRLRRRVHRAAGREAAQPVGGPGLRRRRRRERGGGTAPARLDVGHRPGGRACSTG